MKKIITTVLILSILLASVPFLNIYATENVIYSTSFENGIDDWGYRSDASRLYCKFTTSCSTDGGSSVYLLDNDEEYAVGIDSPYIEITPGETYTLLVNMYYISGGVSAFLKFYDADKKMLTSASKRGSAGKWVDVALTGTAPDNAKYCLINLATYSTSFGKAYFDNLRIVKGQVTPDTDIEGSTPPSEEVVFLYPKDDGIPDKTLLFSESFENGKDEWTNFSKVSADYVTISEDEAYDGKKSLFIDDVFDNQSMGLVSGSIPVSEGNIYTASAYSKTVSGTPAYLYLKFFDENKKELSSGSVAKKGDGWQPVYISRKAPENSVYAKIYLVGNSSTTGTSYVDEVSLYKGIVKPEFLERDFIPPNQESPQDAQIVAPVNDKLQYNTYNDEGDKLSDYSIAGFYGGLYQLPVTSNLPIVATLEPSGGNDDHKMIQEAIDKAERKDGGMNVVKLKAGKYYIGPGGINIKSGVILSGSGQGPQGTILYAYLPYQHRPIKFAGKALKEVGEKAYITDSYVKAGSNKINISKEDIKNFQVGDQILIRQISTLEWADSIGMVGTINVYDDVTTWKEGSVDLMVERTIKEIKGTEITLDYNLFIPYLTEYVPTYITKYDDSERIENAGIENLRIESYFNGKATDEEHATTAIMATYAKNIFVRDITSKYFYMGLFGAGKQSKQITIQNCSCLDPVSEIRGDRRYPFLAYGTSQQILGTGLYAYDGRHDFATSGTAAGAIVYLDSVSEASNTSTETHSLFATGVLYDNIYQIGNETKGFIALANRGIYGTTYSQGWTAASSVAWNCLATTMIVHKPPLTYQNFLVGTWGVYKDSGALSIKQKNITSYKKIYRTGKSTEHTEENFATDNNTSMVGDSYKEAKYTPVNPRSLYKAQLSQRFTGVISNAKPNAPVITYPPCDNTMKNNNIKVSGIAMQGASKVLVYIDNTPYTAKINSDNTFSINVNLKDGNHKIYATQVIDGIEGNKTADRFITINEPDGNQYYHQSIYTPEKTSLILNDPRYTYDEIANMAKISNVEYEKTDSGYTFNVEIDEGKKASEKATVITVLYDILGKFIGYKETEMNNKEEINPINIETKETAHKAKILLWEDVYKIHPLAYSYEIELNK